MLAAGGASALFGVLQAAVASDLKRLLAYSTVENLGLIFVGVGAGRAVPRLGRGCSRRDRPGCSLVARGQPRGFKTLLFLAAGSVVRATGTRDLDAPVRLRERMPPTTGLFAVGA